jgi:hypothetical protein
MTLALQLEAMLLRIPDHHVLPVHLDNIRLQLAKRQLLSEVLVKLLAILSPVLVTVQNAVLRMGLVWELAPLLLLQAIYVWGLTLLLEIPEQDGL